MNGNGNGPSAPYTPAPTHERNLIRDSYILHVRKIGCNNCGATTVAQDLFEVWICRGRKDTRTLRPYAQPLDKSLPVGVSTLPSRGLPLCSNCAHSFDAQRFDSEKSWRETLIRKSAAEAASAAAKATLVAARGTQERPQERSKPSNDLDAL